MYHNNLRTVRSPLESPSTQVIMYPTHVTTQAATDRVTRPVRKVLESEVQIQLRTLRCQKAFHQDINSFV